MRLAEKSAFGGVISVGVSSFYQDTLVRVALQGIQRTTTHLNSTLGSLKMTLGHVKGPQWVHFSRIESRMPGTGMRLCQAHLEWRQSAGLRIVIRPPRISRRLDLAGNIEMKSSSLGDRSRFQERPGMQIVGLTFCIEVETAPPFLIFVRRYDVSICLRVAIHSSNKKAEEIQSRPFLGCHNWYGLSIWPWVTIPYPQ